MKRFLLYLLAVATIVACSKSDDVGGGNNNNNETPKQPEITLSTTAADFSTDGGTNVITFTSSEAWTAQVVNSRADDWCSIEPTSGPAGSAKITVTTTENDTPDDRTASIIIKAGTASKTINVSQKQKDALTITSSKFEVGAEGGEVSIEVKANIDFEYTIEESAADWVEYKATRALKTSNLVFEVKENDDTDKREAKITITSGEFSEVVTIYQEGAEPSIILTENEFAVSSSAETIAVEVKSNVDVTMELPTDADWITENTTRAFSTNTYYFDIEQNDGYDNRTAQIKFTNKATGIYEYVTVTQMQRDAIVVAKDSYTVDSEGDEIVIEVGHNIDFDIEIADDWITRKETRAFKTDKLTFVIAANKGYDNRESTIKFTSKDRGITQTVKVYQAQENALIVSKKDIVVSDEGGDVEFVIQTNVEFTVSKPDVSWLREVTTRGLTSHTLRYEVDPNTSYDSREAKIVVTNRKDNTTETITITQAQKDAIVLAKSEYELGTEGGELDFDIQTNVDITVTISDNAKLWITQIETRGLETKTLHFDIAACAADEDREGTITISGGNATQTITVKQSGLKEILEKEREALIAFYNATGGDNWTRNDNWCSDKPLDEWYGIQTGAWSSEGNVGRLWSISLNDNNLTGTITNELDNLEHLKWIDITGNNLESINIKSCPRFEDIECDGNNLTAINIIDCPQFNFLGCSNNLLTLLDISQFPELQGLNCSNNKLTSLDTSNCPKLFSLSCGGNPITELDLTNNSELDYLYCGYTEVSALDLSNNKKLRTLYCDGCSISSLDLENCLELNDLRCSNNELTELDVSNNKKLYQLGCDYNNLTSLKLDNPELENLFCDTNVLTELDVSKSPKLGQLDCVGNNIIELDLSNNPELYSLWCYDNNLTSLNTKGCTKLEKLLCSINYLTTIDVSDNISLQVFITALNNLTEIDVSMLPNLKVLFAGNNTGNGNPPHSVKNNIKTFDLSNNLALEDFSCFDMNVEDIDVSNNKALKSLECSINPITSLDLSKNSELEELWGHSLSLTELDVSSNLDLTYLMCNNNPNLDKIYIDPSQSFEYIKDETAKFYYKDGSEGDVSSPLYESTDYSKDGEVKQLQKATKGDGIDIVLMGDAYTDRLIADGTYEQTMQTAMEKFFDEEPYKSFRDHFNVYSVTAVSKNEVYTNTSETAFAGYFGGGTLVGGNDQRAFYYAQQAIGEERMDEALIVVMMNSTAYAGTCYMYNPTIGDYGDGVSVSYFPVGEDTESLGRLIHHEAAGHGFSKLGDEYAYQNMGAIPESEIASARTMAEYGWWKNIDFTNDPTKVKWNHFLTDSRYTNDGLGVYEGAFTYWTGAYRPTQNSIMNTNVGGFNAPSRESIYYRIHKLAYGEDWEYDYEEFVEWDAKNRTTTRGIPYRLDIPDNFQPTHPPVVVKSSWRNAKNNAPKKATTNNGGNAGNNLRPATSNRTNQQTMSISPNRTVSSSGMVVTIDSTTGRKTIERMEIK